MLDLPTLERIRLSARPRTQRVVAWALLAPNYHLPPRVQIEIEGLDLLPAEPVIFAMNHTDRYNYWPFQYALWRKRGRFTATWVKGKYYENRFVGKFMELTNNLPTVSRGYLITKDYALTLGRKPSDEDYSRLRSWVDSADERRDFDTSGLPDALLTEPRNVLGRAFQPERESYAEYINALFGLMMKRFVALNAEALELGLDLLVFPQGTRSTRLSRGHIGLAQVALHFKRTIVPVGCNGSDRVYPGSSPVAKGGRVVYRIGEPMSYASLQRYHVDEAFEPFTRDAETRHHDKFQALVDQVMDAINGLLDEPYQYAGDKRSEGVSGSGRFV